jgi:propanediol dehydratase small subunit
MMAAFKKTEDQSPRSTNSSAESTETAAMAAGMALMNQQSTVPGAEGKPDDIAVAEMKMLVEMAGNRLMAGDVYMSMRYITLAQQVQPVIGGYSETKQ